MNNSTKDNDCLDLENNSKCCFFKVANAFLLLANFLLLVVGFYYLPTKQDNAYFSVIVAVLAILVTVLITWQIWQSIDVKNTIKQLQEEAYKNHLSTKFDITNARNLCMALLSNHEGESALNEGKRADAYMKYFTSLCFFLMMGDSKDAARIEKNVKLIEKLLNEDINENKEDYKKRLKEVDKDIDTIYEAILIFSQTVSLPADILNKIRTLHDKRKDYLNK